MKPISCLTGIGRCAVRVLVCSQLLSQAPLFLRLIPLLPALHYTALEDLFGQGSVGTYRKLAFEILRPEKGAANSTSWKA